jgi:hypothetical protein
LARASRTYSAIQELADGPDSPERAAALKALYESQGGTFLPLARALQLSSKQ